MSTNTTNITMGTAILAGWLHYHSNVHQVSEIVINIDPTDTIMTISLKGEDFPVITK